MKNLIAFVLLGSMLSPFVVNGQDEGETVYAKEITPEDTPEPIKEALQKDFPEAVKDIHYYMVPDKMVGSEWSEAMKQDMKTGDNDYYKVEMKGKGGGYVYGLYNQDGELEILKMEAYDFKIPEKITTHATTGKYEGYKIKSQRYSCYKVIDKRTNTEYVQLDIEKGNDSKTLIYTMTGDFVREK